jgi:hypothetical protein
VTVAAMLLGLGSIAAPLAGARGGRAPTFKSIAEYRRQEGLDLDLAGHPKEIAARIRGLLRAWREGDKWARSSDSVWGAPLRKADFRLMNYRQEVLRRWGNQFEGWLARHPEAASTYAGYYANPEKGGWIFVGFTAEEDKLVAEMKRELHVFGPGLIRPFPHQPRYTEAELDALQNSIIEEESSEPLWNSLGIETEANKVTVTTTQVAKVRAVLAERYGTEAPILVGFGRGAVLL